MHLGEQKYASGVMRITSFENRDQSQPLRHTFFHKPSWQETHSSDDDYCDDDNKD